jgi:hypothetical protein
MHQRRRLQSMARCLIRKSDCRELSQFLIHQREQFICRLRIPLFNRPKQLRQVSHLQ